VAGFCRRPLREGGGGLVEHFDPDVRLPQGPRSEGPRAADHGGPGPVRDPPRLHHGLSGAPRCAKRNASLVVLRLASAPGRPHHLPYDSSSRAGPDRQGGDGCRAAPWASGRALGRVGCPVKQGRVLLADGHLGMLGGVHGMLEALFETVLMVADERSLMEAVTAFKPDLVVVDLSLPGGREADIAGRMMQRHPGLRLIVLSVHDEPTVVAQMLNGGVAGFV